MSEEGNRAQTLPLDCSSKEALFRKNHPLIRELKEIPEIRFDDSGLTDLGDILPLKELFLKKNMDYYHVDCLILYKIARNMARIQQKLSGIHICPGLYALEDVYVNLKDTGYPLFLIHPEKFQLMDFEQDYEWYPEDERIFGDLVLFDSKAQALADQRFLYKIMIASSKGNVRIPPKTSSRDYSGLFYGTMPASWKEVFEGGRLQPVSEWDNRLKAAIEMEERYENLSRDQSLPEEKAEEAPESGDSLPDKKTVLGLYVILRGERTNSLEISRLLYETQDLTELEQEHGHFRLIQGFVYGDGVVHQKDLDEYPIGFRLQIPHRIREYSKVEALLIGCEWMADLCRDIAREGVDCQCRFYVLSDGRIENNAIYKACLDKISLLMEEKVQVRLILGRDSQCEGWDHLRRIMGED
ncbi:MAG: hypothetical protein IJH60_00065 [Eubacterium sp.]|nr:hypothetical protein [Eubacterium sp.]